jgi:hypothetical protein
LSSVVTYIASGAPRSDGISAAPTFLRVAVSYTPNVAEVARRSSLPSAENCSVAI